ncbi:SprT-like domain-containing protein (plasmid) [Agrobacterium leguminum]|uniref:SprT-like domain-containing protein n=1 Tax=Agrobacterium leguminum TaxID=2792015 RepID=UPI0010C98C4D|nr:SprT-like domain-containing protein [Agrobacterium leguminum]WFS69541.1 SprT-like domain-containing protein [Agrobacterium leguminum]
MINPTKKTYTGLARAYALFNEELFGGELPACLITMQRVKKAYGYFAGGRFGSKDGAVVTDEIALNPAHFSLRTTEQILSTLVHEMVHLWQHHFGKPSRGGYHNREWAEKMHAVGLVPSSSGEPGGKETGQRVTHYIADGGPFQRVFSRLEEEGFDAFFIELWDDAKKQAARAKKTASKTCYTCPSCGLNAWAKPNARLMCADCVMALQPPAQQTEPEEEERPAIEEAREQVEA